MDGEKTVEMKEQDEQQKRKRRGFATGPCMERQTARDREADKTGPCLS